MVFIDRTVFACDIDLWALSRQSFLQLCLVETSFQDSDSLRETAALTSQLQ